MTQYFRLLCLCASVSARKGLVKGAIAKVGVGEKSKTRFKRNPHKAKSRKGKVSPANQGKGKKGKEPKADQDGRTKEEGKVAAGEKRKDGSHGQGGSKRLKGSVSSSLSLPFLLLPFILTFSLPLLQSLSHSPSTLFFLFLIIIYI